MKQKFYKTPFAENGDKAEISEKTTSDGTVSYQEGWSVDYQRDMEIDKNAKAVERDVMNGILNDITSNIRQYQTMAFPEFITSEDNDGKPFLYTAGTVISYRQNETEDFKNYVSLVDNNSSTPGEDSEKWQEFIFAEATYNEIKNGTSKTKMITPRRLKKATEELEEKISETVNPFILPVGAIIMWDNETVPDGWLEANGQKFDTVLNPKLAKIYPSGRVPDRRGYVPRGWAHGSTVDSEPDRALGSIQGDAIRDIYGKFEADDGMRDAIYDPTVDTGAFTAGEKTGYDAYSRLKRKLKFNGGFIEFKASSVVPTAEENRVKNFATMFIIKTDQACSDNEANTPSALVVTPTVTVLEQGKAIQCTATVLPSSLASDYPVSWTVSDALLGSISSNGLYTAVTGKSGTQTIIASISSGLTSTITIAQHIFITGITIGSIPDLSESNDPYTPSITFTPTNFTEPLEYSSSNVSVASFSNGNVFPSSQGGTTIAVKGSYSGVSASQTVKVIADVIIDEYLKIDNNLSDLNDVETARNNLGLGDLAKKDALNADDVGAFPVTSHFLDDTINLDDVTSNGVHSQNVSSNATFANNYPIEEAGSLIVIKNGVDATSCRQIYLPYNSTSEFRRYGLGSPIVWSLWEEKKIAGPKLELKKVSDLPNADDIKPDDLVMVVQDKDGVLTSSKSTTEAMKAFFNTGVVKSINGDIPDEQGNINVKTGIDEAPNNGYSYIRKNKKWVSTNENVIEGDYIIDARFSSDDCTDLILDFRFKNIFKLIPMKKWTRFIDEHIDMDKNLTMYRLGRGNVEVRPPKEGRVIILLDGSEGDQGNQKYKTVAVYFGVGVKVLLSTLQFEYTRKVDNSGNIISESYWVTINKPLVQLNDLNKIPLYREWVKAKISVLHSSFDYFGEGMGVFNFYYETPDEKMIIPAVNPLNSYYSFSHYNDDDDMSVSLSAWLKEFVEDHKVTWKDSYLLFNYMTSNIVGYVSVSDETKNGVTSPVFDAMLSTSGQTSGRAQCNYNTYQNIKDCKIKFSSNKTLIFPTDVEDYAWALVYRKFVFEYDFERDPNILPGSRSFTYEMTKFSDNLSIKIGLNLVLINKNTLKPIKISEFKQWVLEKRDEYRKQESFWRFFSLTFPVPYYCCSFEAYYYKKNILPNRYCRYVYLDVPDSVDAFSLMCSCDELSYVNPQTITPVLTFTSKGINPDFNENYDNRKFYFKFNFTAPINNDYIGESEFKDHDAARRVRTLVKTEIVQNGEYYNYFDVSWRSYNIGIDGNEISRKWQGIRDENGAYLLTQSDGNLSVDSKDSSRILEQNEVTFWLSDKDSAINPDGSFKKVVVRLTYNDGVKTTVFEEELQPEI